MKNFGFFDFAIVRPRCELGVDAVKYAKHASEILRNVKIFETLNQATKDCDLVVGTSGITRRNKDTLRSLVKLKEFEKRLGKYNKKKKIAIIFGNEGVGLSANDISECDLLIKIETSKEYPVMNLSHAVAVVLYSMPNGLEAEIEEECNKEQRTKIIEYSREIAKKADVRSKEYVVLAIKRIFSKSNITKKEANFLIGFLNDVKRRID
jgi:TrmH family RNA methyltransferase